MKNPPWIYCPGPVIIGKGECMAAALKLKEEEKTRSTSADYL
jgi:hypothetical protein